MINSVVDSRQTELFDINDLIINVAGDILNGLLLMGLLYAFSIANYEKELAQYQYERDYLCSQSRTIVGYSEGNAYIMKTLYVSCEAEIGRIHNFMRGPDVEKKFAETLLYSEKIGLTRSPLAI